MKNRIFKIVFTGGPGAGKTTSLAKIREGVSQLGFKVLIAPETPTLLMLAGVDNDKRSPEARVLFQSTLIKMQLAFEEIFNNYAKSLSESSPVVVIFDRAMMDGKAFCTPEEWDTILYNFGVTESLWRDRRYDAVLHLETAAMSAAKDYTTANNATRIETASQAIAADIKLKNAWSGCPHFKVIPSNPSFEEKIRTVLRAISKVIGKPVPLEIERKFLVKDASLPPADVRFSYIEQVYIYPSKEGTEERVRRRVQDGTSVFFHTVKTPKSTGERFEEERMISADEYFRLKERKLPGMAVIQKERKTFLWEKHYFELDYFVSPKAGLQILEVELDDINESVSFPPWISIDKEVTNCKDYSNYYIAHEQNQH